MLMIQVGRKITQKGMWKSVTGRAKRKKAKKTEGMWTGSCSGRDCKDIPTRPGEAITQGSLATLISFACARVPAGFTTYPWTHGTESPHGLASPRVSFCIFNSLYMCLYLHVPAPSSTLALVVVLVWELSCAYSARTDILHTPH